MNLDPGDLLIALEGAVAAWAAENHSKVSIAVSRYHALEILAQNVPGARLVVHWGGDEDENDNQYAGITKNVLTVFVAYNRGLGATPGKELVEGRDGGKSLLKMVSEIRAIVRGIEFSNPDDETTNVTPWYRGAVPAQTPSGMNLDAYEMTFWLWAALVTEDEISSDTPASSSSESA